MKCPKCQYLGFDTGHRCRNCGYDFSLLSLAEAPASEPDLLLRPPEGAAGADGVAAQRTVDLPLRPASSRRTPRARPPAPPRADLGEQASRGVSPADVRLAPGITPGRTELPLFPAGMIEDEPLITVAPAPRPPLAVRKTPELLPGARPPRVVRREDRPRFADTIAETAPGQDETASRPPVAPAVQPESCAPRPRLLAGLIDGAILLALDLVIVYFTLRMAGLAPGEWLRLPLVPMAGFLAGVQVAYVAAFTAVGGQTIGKMALQIRVVTEEDRPMRPGPALGRALALAVSLLPLGAGFAPALVGGRALHDRLARTRVVSAPPTASA